MRKPTFLKTTLTAQRMIYSSDYLDRRPLYSQKNHPVESPGGLILDFVYLFFFVRFAIRSGNMPAADYPGQDDDRRDVGRHAQEFRR